MAGVHNPVFPPRQLGPSRGRKVTTTNMITGVSLIEGEGEAEERVDPRIIVVVFITPSSRRGS